MAKQLFPVTFTKPGQVPEDDKNVKTFDTRGFRRPERAQEAPVESAGSEDQTEAEDGQEGAPVAPGGTSRRLGSA